MRGPPRLRAFEARACRGLRPALSVSMRNSSCMQHREPRGAPDLNHGRQPPHAPIRNFHGHSSPYESVSDRIDDGWGHLNHSDSAQKSMLFGKSVQPAGAGSMPSKFVNGLRSTSRIPGGCCMFVWFLRLPPALRFIALAASRKVPLFHAVATPVKSSNAR